MPSSEHFSNYSKSLDQQSFINRNRPKKNETMVMYASEGKERQNNKYLQRL